MPSERKRGTISAPQRPGFKPAGHPADWHAMELSARIAAERRQAWIRLLTVGVAVVYAVRPGDAVVDAGALLRVAVASAAFSALVLARTLVAPRGSAARRVLAVIHDASAATLWLAHAGPAGASLLVLFPLAALGHGFCFGAGYALA